MKKISAVLLAVSFLLVETGCSKKTTNEIQERNGISYAPNETVPFTGLYQTNYPSGQKQAEENYVEGKLNGLVIMWFESGQKQAELNYTDGNQDGLTVMWNENGQKIYEGNWVDGKENGLQKYWHDNGTLL